MEDYSPLPWPWHAFDQQLLTAVGRISSATLVGVSTNVAVGVADVVEVFFLEFVCDISVPVTTVIGHIAHIPSVTSLKLFRQNAMHSFMSIPIPFRKSVY